MLDATAKLPEESGHGSHQTYSSISKAIHFTTNPSDLKGKINIITDAGISGEYHSLWIWGSNCDPVRDSSFYDNLLVMDATAKSPAPNVREWPPMALSSAETINKIDKKWESLGIDSFIESPSLRFRQK
jgi:hypothetical protein